MPESGGNESPLVPPESEVRMYLQKIDKALALHVDNIPMNQDTQAFFYPYEKTHDQKHAFSFIELASSEESQGALASGEVLRQEYERILQSRPETTMTFPEYIKKKSEFKQALERAGRRENTVPKLLNTEYVARDPENSTAFINSQYSEILTLLGSVIRMDENHFPTTALLTDKAVLIQMIIHMSKEPSKPILIVRGHGGPRVTSTGVMWSIGEQKGSESTTLNRLFDHIKEEYGADYFSAVLLVSCNTGKIRPPKLSDNTMIVYANGLVGYDQQNRSGDLQLG